MFQMYKPTDKLKLANFEIRPSMHDEDPLLIKATFECGDDRERCDVVIVGYHEEAVLDAFNQAVSTIDQHYNEVFDAAPAPSSGSTPLDEAIAKAKALDEDTDEIPF